jgi:NTE family protein
VSESDRGPQRTTVGLVLGAGGVAGAAFHAGALAALVDATGWDPGQADLVVGTSAGASTAASLRSGLGAPDLLARATGRPLSEAGAELVGPFDGPFALDELAATSPRSRWDQLTRFVPAAPWLAGPALLRAGPTRWGVALAGLVPAGQVPTDLIGQRIRAAARGRWPDDPTWIVAYRTGDARRVVFGRDDVEVADLATAVEASSAVPGRFRPKRLESGRYLDGAVYSPTNADLVAPLAFDLVIVSAPMSVTAAARADQSGLAGRARGWFAGLLDREVAAVAERGAATLVIEPGHAELLAMRSDLPDRELGSLVAEAAYESVRVQLADPEGQATLELLARADH